MINFFSAIAVLVGVDTAGARHSVLQVEVRGSVAGIGSGWTAEPLANGT